MLDLLPDLCDLHPNQTTVIERQYNHYGTKAIFFGQAVTVKCFEDNSRVKELLATPGKGKVLVVDGGGSLRRALLGDMIAQSAVKNEWEGVIIDGAIRDVATINQLDIGVKALGTVPLKTDRKGQGETSLPVTIAGTQIKPDDWVYTDLNGIVISQQQLTLEG